MNQCFEVQIQIAGLSLRIEYDLQPQIACKFQSFCEELDNVDYTVRFRQVDSLPSLPLKVIYEGSNYRVHEVGGESCVRSFTNSPWDNSPYAVATYNYGADLIQVDYLKKGSHCVSEIGNSFAHLNFEELLLRKERLCLHASCVDTHIGGILFSGPSGVGKSTQADLWCTLRGARQINGDRPILSRDGTGWLAWGSPYAGSSKCHVNESCPIRAAIMIRKGSECSIRKLPPAEAFRKVWAGLTVHTWDADFVNAACDLAQEFVNAVPVYELICTPDEQAVICLEEELKRRNAYDGAH